MFSPRDTEYMEAYFDGDEDLMQELVNEAAYESGYKYKAYHHTENGFTVFDRSRARRNMDIQGFFFSADSEAESEYGSVRYDVFLKMDNPYIIDSKEKRDAIPIKFGTEDYGVKVREWLQDQGYDSVIRDADYYGSEADEYIVFESERIKSAEPVTYSDDEYGEGDVIPLSERFNSENKDIRYSTRVTNNELSQRDDVALYVKNTKKANYIGMILNGTKTVETRKTRTLDKYIGKEMPITDGEYVYGYMTLGEPEWITSDEFRKKENVQKHRIPKGDIYDIQLGQKGKWAYPIDSYRKIEKKKLSDSNNYKYSFQAREVKFSIRNITDDKGNDYGLGVHLDSTLLTGLSDSERREMVKEYIKSIGGVEFEAKDMNGDIIKIHIEQSNKYFKDDRGKRKPVNKDLIVKHIGNTVKQESIALIDELVSTSKYDKNQISKRSHGWVDGYGKNNWNYWNTYVQDMSGDIWKVTLNVATSKDGTHILYDLDPIKK